MKRNAIARIVLWSIVIAVLLAILLAAIFLPGIRSRSRDTIPAETYIPRPVTETTAQEKASPSGCNAVAVHNINVRKMPSEESDTAGMVEQGASMEITRVEFVNGSQWGYTTYPVQGWVLMEHVGLLESIEETRIVIDTPVQQEEEITGYGVNVDAENIQKIEIEWGSGSVRILTADVTQIHIQEEGPSQAEHPMVWDVREQTLSIQFIRNADREMLMGKNSKDLIIQVPRDWICRDLEIEVGAASLDIIDLTVGELEFDGASGTCNFENCTVEKLELDTASGDVYFSGSLGQLECDTASASVALKLNNVPRALEMDTASGDLDVTLPETAGFSLRLETVSGDFSSAFNTTSNNGSYVCGDGSCRMEVESMSGDVTIRKGA